MEGIYVSNLQKVFTETNLENVVINFLKRSHASTMSIWTEDIQAKSEEWTTQTAINCDTFSWLQSFGTRNSSLTNT